jgi:hypothetical protein
MDTCHQPHQPGLPLDHPTQTYSQLIHTLTGLLPPPLANTPEALLARNNAAIAQAAALLPVNANEARLTTQCVAASAQAEDVMRLLRQHNGDDIKTVIKLNAQYVALVRASLGAHGHLLRAQAVRHKREQNSAALNADEWTQHIAICSMQRALGTGPVPAIQAADPSAPASVDEEQPTPAPALVTRPPAPALAAAPPQAPAVEEPAEEPPAPAPVSTPAAKEQPAPAASVPPMAPQRSRRTATPAEPDEPPRNLPTEADYYAVVYPNRAREIRHHAGLPPNCSFGPPDDDLVHAIVTGSTPALRALDGANAAVA